MPGCERSPTVTHTRITGAAAATRETSHVCVSTSHREKEGDVFRWHTFATNLDYSREPLDPSSSLSLSLALRHSQPREGGRGLRVNLFFQPVCHYIYGPAVLESFSPTINIYIYRVRFQRYKSIASRSFAIIFSPSHCHRSSFIRATKRY